MVVQNQLGLHARPASMFVKMAARFQCDILVEKEGEEKDTAKTEDGQKDGAKTEGDENRGFGESLRLQGS